MAPTIDPTRFTNLAVEEREDGIWVVTLNRAAKRNALDSHTVEELVEFFLDFTTAGMEEMK